MKHTLITICSGLAIAGMFGQAAFAAGEYSTIREHDISAKATAPNLRAQKFIDSLKAAYPNEVVVNSYSNWSQATYVSITDVNDEVDVGHAFFTVYVPYYDPMEFDLGGYTDLGGAINMLAYDAGCASNVAYKYIWHDRHYPDSSDWGDIYTYAKHAETICPN